MSGEQQEPSLGEILRGQARIEKALDDFIEDQRKQNHVFRNAINANNVASALHAQKLEDMADLKLKVEGMTATANKIAGAWAVACIAGTALVTWLKR